MKFQLATSLLAAVLSVGPVTASDAIPLQLLVDLTIKANPVPPSLSAPAPVGYQALLFMEDPILIEVRISLGSFDPGVLAELQRQPRVRRPALHLPSPWIDSLDISFQEDETSRVEPKVRLRSTKVQSKGVAPVDIGATGALSVSAGETLVAEFAVEGLHPGTYTVGVSLTSRAKVPAHTTRVATTPWLLTYATGMESPAIQSWHAYFRARGLAHDGHTGFAAVEEAFQKAIALQPDNYSIQHELADLSWGRVPPARTIEHYEHVLATLERSARSSETTNRTQVKQLVQQLRFELDVYRQVLPILEKEKNTRAFVASGQSKRELWIVRPGEPVEKRQLDMADSNRY